MAGRSSAADFTVALIGNPNVGKSTLFNRLTGLRQHTGNWSGKTVEQAEGFYPYKGKRYRLVDLPGTYSLRSRSRDEAITATYLRQQTPDCVLVICDGTCLERNLILVQQLLGLTTRLVVAVNLLDEAARRGIALDLPLLQRQLGAPVVGISAGHGTGLPQLQELVRQVCQGYLAAPGDGSAASDARQEARRAGQIARMTVQQAAPPQANRFDRLLMRRGFGAAFLLFLLLGLLWLTIAGANYPTAALQAGFDALGRCLARWLQGLPPFLFSLLTQGLYATAARVVAVMLPPMAIFFPLFTLLEDAGLLPRVAFLLDRPFARCGGEGQMALPMCMGLGCNAAGITGCRILSPGPARTAAILTNALIPCNGRFPALILLAGMLLGAFGLDSPLARAAVLLLALAMSVAATLLLCHFITARTSSTPGSFLLELPPYRKPRIGQVLVRAALDRTLRVLGRAVCIAAPAGCMIWLLAHCTLPGGETLLQAAAAFLEAPGHLLGLSGPILLAFFLSLPANELMLPLCLLILCGGSLDAALPETAMAATLAGCGWTWKTALCCMIFFLFHWPCGTSIATIWRETRRWQTVLAAICLPTALGAALCFMLQWLLRLL